MLPSSRPPLPSSPTSSSNSDSLESPTDKIVDLNSYFLDLDGEKEHDEHRAISKLRTNLNDRSSSMNYVQFDQISNFKEAKKPTLEIALDFEGAVEEGEGWIHSEWKALIGKGKVEESDIRKLILSRKVLQPTDLKDWLDSPLYGLPDISLGVLLRLDPLASGSTPLITVPQF